MRARLRRAAPKVRFAASGDHGRWLPLRLWFHIALFFGLAVASLFVLWAIFKGVFSPSLKDELKVEVIRLSLFIIAGIGGVFALVIAYRRQGLNEAAEVRVERAEAREDGKVFNERFKSAAEQLASEQAANRLAGVYAMAGLADDWDAGRQTCINVLCAYLRMPYEPPEDPAPPAAVDADTADGEAANTKVMPLDPQEQKARRQERQVRHTIVNVIRERLRARPVKGKTWHSHDFDFTEAHFDGGDLSGIHVTGGAMRFEDTVFSSAGFSFAGAQCFGGLIDFTRARFANAWLDFGDAHFGGSEVRFRKSVLSAEWIRFSDVEFANSRIDFGEALFVNTGLVFFGSEFSGGRVGFSEARFSGGQVYLSLTVFTGGEIDFSEALGWDTLTQFKPPSGPNPTGLLLPHAEAEPEAEPPQGG